MMRIAAALLACACAGAAFIGSLGAANADVRTAGTGAADPNPGDDRIRPSELRKYLAKFIDPAVAESHGYKPTDVCSEYPYRGADGMVIGGMGYHYANPELIADPQIDPFRPEVLVYTPTPDGGRVLGAVEYIKIDDDQRIATPQDRPSLFGWEFQGPKEPTESGIPIHYQMHIWLFKHNPRGLFEPWNPRVTCPANSERTASSVGRISFPAAQSGQAGQDQQAAAEQVTAEQDVTEQDAAEQTTTEQAVAEQDTAEQAIAEQDITEQVTAE